MGGLFAKSEIQPGRRCSHMGYGLLCMGGAKGWGGGVLDLRGVFFLMQCPGAGLLSRAGFFFFFG